MSINSKKRRDQKKNKHSLKSNLRSTARMEGNMSYIQEYIGRQRTTSGEDLGKEQQSIIRRFNERYNCYLLIYASATEKVSIPENQVMRSDFEAIYDLLMNVNAEKVMVYLETNGGSGEAAKEIADFLHEKFKEVYFLITGQAKSAGTILALSGDEIYMTGCGALGPIDAQVKVGRYQSSAYGYMKWVDEKREEAAKNGRLNPFDAQMVAQIAPQEIEGVNNALNFAINCVREWLPKYKFKNWTKTETRNIPVDDAMRVRQAEKIATELTKQDKWYSHGLSLKIRDLNEVGLKPIDVDDDKEMADMVYRIQAINRIIFGSTSSYKIFATATNRILRNAVEKGGQVQLNPAQALQKAEVVEATVTCQKCLKNITVYMKFKNNPKIDENQKALGNIPFPKDGRLQCACGEMFDLNGLRSEIENQKGQKII